MSVQQFQTERRDDGIHSEVFIFLGEGPLRHWTAHRVSCSRYDLDLTTNDAALISPEPRITLVGFGGNIDDLPRYIESLREVERQTRALREEKHAEYQAWRESLAVQPAPPRPGDPGAIRRKR